MKIVILILGRELLEKRRLNLWKKYKEEGLPNSIAHAIKDCLEQGIELAKKIYRLSAQDVSIAEIASKCNVSENKVRKILE